MTTRNASKRSTGLGKLFRKSLAPIAYSATVLSASLFSGGGCTRQQYRCKTDTEAYYLLDEKLQQSCEENANPYRIEVDARSRMFDPFNPDRPPMPEDDPQSNRFMRCVDGKKGYPLWEANGRTNIVENPQWWNYLPLDERGVLVLDLNDSVRTALVHSTNYQSNLEELYLSALDVSSERFLLDSQFFGGWQSSYTSDGRRRSGDSSSLFATGPNSAGRRPFSMQKRYATGADLLVGFANSLTWQLAGPNDQSASSILDFSLIQPLLRQGGRDVVLERLTLAERTLLANVRAFERYRRAFYIQVATGRGPDTSPQRRGGVFGGAGFAGFTGLGGGFGNLGGGGGGFGGGGGVPGAGGYLGLLQSQLQIANQQETITRLQDLYLQLEDTYRELLLTMPANQTEIPSQQIQVAQAKQSVFDAQTSLLQQQTGYQADLDNFKSTLGLPPYLCIEINDSLLDQFKLISQDLRERRTDVAVFRADIGQDNSAILGLTRTERDEESGEAFRVIDKSPELSTHLGDLREKLEPLREILEAIQKDDLAQLYADIDALRQNIPIRRQQLNRLKDIAIREQGMVCSLLPFGDFNTSFLDGTDLEQLPDELIRETERLTGLIEEQVAELQRVTSDIDNMGTALDELETGRERFALISDGVILGTQDLVASINESVIALQIVQARARTQSVLLPEIDIEPRDALEIARSNRRDWLNNRAALVNSWRAIEVVADDLESVLDLTVSGDVLNVGDNPLDMRLNTGRLRVGLAWDAPITRLQERNNYRQVLIEYQRAKRSYYQYEDAVWASMRSTLRTVRQNQLSFEIQRFAVQNAGLQISVNEDIRQINETLGQVSGPTAARDAVQGLQAFLGTQSQLIGIYVNYEAIRRSLDLDLGTMEVDAEGLWIDPGPIRADNLGGVLGDAIMDYGLTEGEKLMRDQIQSLEDQPIEVAASDQLPITIPVDNVGGVIGQPVEAARIQPSTQFAQPIGQPTTTSDLGSVQPELNTSSPNEPRLIEYTPRTYSRSERSIYRSLPVNSSGQVELFNPATNRSSR